MTILGMTAPELVVIAATYAIPILVLYWVIRFAVKHGVKDALAERSKDGGQEKHVR